ncbi:flagellar biosynthetic protein FliO [Sphingomonas sp.]|uniref:flagellar biosynthetic protein FliO n=1 Tax=Sphingomonas sp. TaxID=28214 RepID=UPI001B0EBCAB|nr:flagellar biosynthetic protein FliO [Sphingomonas sp.]MBO9713479.1 FliO/MopB family protein [Sphingomonas sp.]
MDILGLLRTLGALGLVLGMLASALWVVKRYDLRLPGRVTGGSRRRRIELVERLSVDAKRSVALIRRDGCEHLVLMGPDGHAVLETGIEAPPPPPEAETAPAANFVADAAALKSAFGKLVERVSTAQAAPAAADNDTQPPAPPVAEPVLTVVPAVEPEPAAAALKKPAAPRKPRSNQGPRGHGYSGRWNRAALREVLNG